MLSKPMLLALTASLSIAAAQMGCSTSNTPSYSAGPPVSAPTSLQQACIEEGARIVNVSADQVYAIQSTELSDGTWDINLMLGARQGICSVDSQGKILSIRGQGGTLY